MNPNPQADVTAIKNPLLSRAEFVLILIGVGVLLFGYWSGLDELVRRWLEEDEYSHGLLLPFVALFFTWQEWPRVRSIAWRPSWWGAVIVLLSAMLYLVGEISALYLLVHYAFVLTLYGVAVAMLGWRASTRLLVPLAILLFAIPIPYFLQSEMSASLQLLSSRLGVAMVEALGIPVFLEGNVIDLGTYQLQVVDACSGLRYMFPLMSLGFICAYLFRVEWWKRVLVFLSTIPITVLMNSFRIAVCGVLVDWYGIAMAEGFIHDFEGWSIFGACMVVLLIEMWILTKVGRRSAFRETFGIEFSRAGAVNSAAVARRPPAALLAGLTVICLSVIVGHAVRQRVDMAPQRKPLVLFPEQFGEWHGRTSALEPRVLDKLQLTDYVLADYAQSGFDGPVNFYVAYYENQRKGASPHSPRVCIPGGGWEITRISRELLPFSIAGREFRYNRVIIQKGQYRQLVYYWFQQRGRIMANEYLMKWYLFVDALRENRTDGAMVRLTTPILPSEDIKAADERLIRFAGEAMRMLPGFVPD